jgi:hypothetical protein
VPDLEIKLLKELCTSLVESGTVNWDFNLWFGVQMKGSRL